MLQVSSHCDAVAHHIQKVVTVLQEISTSLWESKNSLVWKYLRAAVKWPSLLPRFRLPAALELNSEPKKD